MQAQIAEGRELCPWLAYRSGDQFWLWRLSTGLLPALLSFPWHGVACAPCLPASGVSPHIATTPFSLCRCISSPDNNNNNNNNNNSPCLRASCLRPSPHGTPSFRSKSCTSSVVHSWMCTCPTPPLPLSCLFLCSGGMARAHPCVRHLSPAPTRLWSESGSHDSLPISYFRGLSLLGWENKAGRGMVCRSVLRRWGVWWCCGLGWNGMEWVR